MARVNIQAPEINADLLQWNQVQDRFKRGALLLGNGASRALWDAFGYPSLYQEALGAIDHPLTPEDQAFFQHIGSENFEQVLAVLSTSASVCAILGHDQTVTHSIYERYESIRTALVEAVHAVHVRREDIPDTTLASLQNELRSYHTVYSTNYDLLVYWAVMHNNDKGAGFVDFFWTSPNLTFDISNTAVWQEKTRVFYLHGGLHLYHDPITGIAGKSVRAPQSNLLDQFGQLPAGTVPLFVSEGDATSKKNSISRSSYLSFAFNQFQRESQALVILGSSLAESDQHLIDGIVNWGDRPIAVSMLSDPDPRVVRARKADYHNRLQKDDIAFFDAATHPMTCQGLQL